MTDKRKASEAPRPIQNWLSSLPSQNVGTLYATVKSPLLGWKREFKVEGWGQLCDGTDHKQMVHLHLHNHFRDHGKGYTYVSWRAVPDNPQANNYPREGLVQDPKPYSGIAYD